jgi:two-component system copper resistance phosphate regulon response regulator CusR
MAPLARRSKSGEGSLPTERSGGQRLPDRRNCDWFAKDAKEGLFQMRILLIEDEKKTAAFLTKGLREAGFIVELARDGEKGLELARATRHDLLIVDVMLPKKDGWAVVSQLRGAGLQTPILFLTARDSVKDRVKGLELGADDYLVKPYAFSELLARVRSVLRRSPTREPEQLKVKDLEIDTRRHKAVRAGVQLNLTAKEFLLLAHLAALPVKSYRVLK